MQASIILCLSQAKINWEGCGRNGIRCKNGEMMEVGAPVVRMGASRRIVGASASCYLSPHHKIQKVARNNGGSR